MPNWVTTSIDFVGSKSEIAKIVEHAKLNSEFFGERTEEQTFDFNGFIPRPKKLDGTRSPVNEMLLSLMLAEETPSLADDDLPLSDNIVQIWHNTPTGKARGLYDFQIQSIEQKVKNWFPTHTKLSAVLAELANHEEYQAEKAKDENRLNFECLKEFGFADWYEWSVAHWGTKWNCRDVFADVTSHDNNDNLTLVFDTAWDLPKPILEHICENYNVEIFGASIDECGNFAAVIRTVGGFIEVEYITPDEDLDRFNNISLELYGYKLFDDEEVENE